MKPIFYKIKNSFSYKISCLLRDNIRWFISFVCTFLIGALTGIFTASKYAADLEPSNLINEYLYSLLTKDKAMLSYFIILVVYFTLVSLFVIFLTRNRLMILVDGLLLFFMSYIWGFDICVIFVSLGLAGIILGFICNVILGLIFFLNLCLIFAIVAKMKTCEKKPYYKQNEYVRLYVVLWLIGIVILFLISLIFSLIHIFVIVG